MAQLKTQPNDKSVEDFLNSVEDDTKRQDSEDSKQLAGEQARQLVSDLRPDLVTLDLEMPRMDGFTLLRIVMQKQPTPIIVVSSRSDDEDVFKALELGAVEFVPKPPSRVSPVLIDIREELLAKGQMPKCVDACEAGALVFGDLEDPSSEISQLLRSRSKYVLKKEVGTRPQVYYLI